MMDRPHKDKDRKSEIFGLRLFIFAIILTLVFLVSISIWNHFDWKETKVVKSWQKEVEPAFVDNVERPQRRLPQAIIIGSRKSGTRALLKFLSINPNIRPASKEVHFFDRMHRYKLGLEWYKEQMPLSLAGQITIEKSPAYFVTKGVPERIKAMNSSVKLILVVRNPVTRLISDFSQLFAHKTNKEFGSNMRDYDDYYHMVLSGDEPIDSVAGENNGRRGENNNFKSPQWTATTNVSLEQMWTQAEINFQDYVRRSDGGINEQRRAIKGSMYSNYIEQWLGQFKRDQLYILDGERLISEPAEELRKVESFLGLVPVITRADFIYNQTKGFFCLAATAATRNNISKVADSSGSSSSRGLIPSRSRSRRRREVKATTTVGSVCLGDDKGRRHVRVGKNFTQQLQQFYYPFNEYLYSLVGQNFNWSHVDIK